MSYCFNTYNKSYFTRKFMNNSFNIDIEIFFNILSLLNNYQIFFATYGVCKCNHALTYIVEKVLSWVAELIGYYYDYF